MAACRISASSFRNPSGVMSQPEATGLIARVRMPRAFAASSRVADTRVLPTPVSVPVTK